MMNQFLVECKTIANRNHYWHTWTLIPFTEPRPFARAAQQVIEGHPSENVEILGVYRVPRTGDYPRYESNWIAPVVIS